MVQWPLPQPMKLALDAAKRAAHLGEVPVGAVIVRDGEVLSIGANCTRNPPDPSGHAEIRVIREAAQKLKSERLIGCDIYVTLEPCAMCAGAISHARISRLYYAASDTKGGAVANGARVFDQPQCMHKPEVYSGLGASESELLLKDFFKARR
jgi:tRNA(adenine34) deaminase